MRHGFTLILVVCCFAALFLICYGPALLLDRQFGYRDAGHYYYPLYQRVQNEWAQGRWPLWEPQENAGMPLLGNPTAAVLYPGSPRTGAIHYARPEPSRKGRGRENVLSLLYPPGKAGYYQLQALSPEVPRA